VNIRSILDRSEKLNLYQSMKIGVIVIICDFNVVKRLLSPISISLIKGTNHHAVVSV